MDENIPKSLNRLEVMRGLRMANIEFFLFNAGLVLLTGPFLIGYARSIGANYFWIGVLTALPFWGELMEIPGALWASRFASRRRFVLPIAFIERLAYVPIILVAVFAATHSTPVGFSVPLLLLALSYTAASALMTARTPAWMAWLADIVPEDIRGRYFGWYNALKQLPLLVIAIPVGWYLDVLLTRHIVSPQLAFGSVFAIACLCLFGAYYALFLRPEAPRVQEQAARSFGDTLKAIKVPLADKQFMRLVFYFAIANGMSMLIGPFVTAYMLDPKPNALNLGYFMVNMISAISGVSGILSLRTWGYFSDKYGNKPLLVVSGFGFVVPPIVWALINPSMSIWTLMIILIPMHIFAGINFSGLMLSQFNLTLALSTDENRPGYLALLNTVTGLMAGTGSLVGGALLTRLSLTSLGLEHSFELMLSISALGRGLALLFLRKVRDPQASSTRYFISQITSAKPSGWTALSQMNRSRSEQDRVKAADALGQSKMAVGVDELIKALDDPSPEVRRSSAQALGRIGDAKALPALVNKLEDEASNIEPEAAKALGDIGDSEAVPVLVEKLDHPNPTVRQAAASALDQMGDSRGAEVLADDSGTGISANDMLEMPFDEIIKLLNNPEAHNRADAAEALRLLGEPKAAPILREQLEKEDQPLVVGALAYALGWLSDCEDAPLLLSKLATIEHPHVRNRIALGVAHIWGVEDELYKLFALEEMEQDKAIMKIVKPLIKNAPNLSEAIDAYAAGNHQGLALALA
ncbi:MAG: MFS transporter, partial [bacterium]